MLTFSEIQDYQNHLDEHQDYITLMREYSSNEIFEEIIHFMDLAFPEWTSNRGIGNWSAEFVLTNIQNLEFLYDEIENNSSEVLKNIYLSLVYDYKRTQVEYGLMLKSRILNSFSLKHEELLFKNEHLPAIDFNVLYDELYSNYETQTLNIVTYLFI